MTPLIISLILHNLKKRLMHMVGGCQLRYRSSAPPYSTGVAGSASFHSFQEGQRTKSQILNVQSLDIKMFRHVTRL